MSACMQASQETAQQISQKESVMVIQNLISISVAEVLCRRGVIRDDSLESIKFAGATLRRIKEGSCSDPKVNRLALWMKDGLQEALRNNHLRSLIFEIHGDKECKNLLEMYRFDVDSMSGISISRQGKPGISSTQNSAPICLDKDAIKQGTQALLRKIQAIVETFDDGEEESKVPDEHYLAMKMVYFPSEELNNFQPAGFSHFAEALDPEKDTDDIADMEIGSLRTAHHSLMKHRSIGKSKVLRSSPYPPQRLKIAKSQTNELNKVSSLGKAKYDQSHSDNEGVQRQQEDENMMICSQEQTYRNEIAKERKLMVSVPANPIHQIREWSD